MPVNKEELVKDLDAPEYQTLVKETLARKEFVVQDKAEHANFLEKHKTDVIEKEIPSKIKAVHDQYDRDTKELFGLERLPDEKSYDYLKRAARTKLSDLQTSAEKIRTLEEAIKKGDTSGAMAKRLEDEEAKFKLLIQQKDATISKLEKETQTTAKAADIKLAYSEIKKTFRKDLPPMFARLESAVIQDAIGASIIKDGKLYKANSDGTIAKDASYNEITIEDFLKTEFKEVIEVKKSAGGGGSKDEPPIPGADPSKMTADTFPMRQDLKTKGDLMDYMKKLGLKEGTKQFDEIYKKFGLPLPVAVQA